MTQSTQNKVDSKQDLINYVVRLGDDSIVLGHRISEWVSYGPFLEEDIALGNVALDYIGRARMFYGYAATLTGDGKTEDDFAFLRNEREFENYLINELPRGDFAYTIVRQLLVDLYNKHYLEALKLSTDPTLVAIAEKAAKETRYHCRRSTSWTLRLGDGTDESKRRMQLAIDDIWGYSHELFESEDLEKRLVEAGIAVDCANLKQQWLADVDDIFQQAGLNVPQAVWAVRGGRKGHHSEHLGHLLTQMQFLQRSFPGAKW
jgi:ring-1,2-phenylacetyl-CoA epoxidase subunit PaaC